MEPNEYRYVASRVVFSGNEPVNYELALKGTEDLTDLDDGEATLASLWILDLLPWLMQKLLKPIESFMINGILTILTKISMMITTVICSN